MNSFIRKITFDKAALSLVTITTATVLGEAFLRTSLADGEDAKQSRYPPLSSIITKGEEPCNIYRVILFVSFVLLILTNLTYDMHTSYAHII